MNASVDMTLPRSSYDERRGRLETYFDRTALDAWTQLTSDAPVSKIRATVRAGRDSMRDTLLSWLPEQLTGAALFDAGCGTGALSVAAARRGARVTGVDVSASLVQLGGERAPKDLGQGSLDFRVGDMLDASFGRFDYVVAMDSLIHYPSNEILRVLGAFASRTSNAILFTFAPRTPALSLMHAAGKLFPRADRAPAIEPVSESVIRKGIAASSDFAGWSIGRTQRISSGFYKSQAMELVRP
ncbi:MAG: magnesium protoporphyrin IX methyltransferase [Hyphomonadaceae bacterium]|nr:magnesium protoporphyrin IX methyltransferase [Hyphomonadaceae bacterium]